MPRRPDGAKRNPGQRLWFAKIPDYASLHSGYELFPEKRLRRLHVLLLGRYLAFEPFDLAAISSNPLLQLVNREIGKDFARLRAGFLLRSVVIEKAHPRFSSGGHKNSSRRRSMSACRVLGRRLPRRRGDKPMAHPAIMRAVAISEPGGPDVLV